VEQECIRGLSDVEVRELRQVLHDLSSVFTGILVSGGLMNMALAGDKRERYATEICEGAERGAALVRRARSVLTAPEQRIENVARTVPRLEVELDGHL
jgi:hypothetical protein